MSPARLPLLTSLCLALAAASLPGQAAPVQLGPHRFTLPDGLTVELAAPPSLVPRPIEADFDEEGRLYVSDSSGSNESVRQQLEKKPHRVLRLEDRNGDGVFDHSVVFADRLMFPEGVLWHEGSLYVSAPPSIWKLTDTNADGVADVRVEWFKGQTLGGCANDLHGPYLGPDGWIYWCKGGFERQTHALGDGRSFSSRASHIWRARPDGSGLEPLMTGGMDNPVGLAWSAEGELFVSGTFFQHPDRGRRDGLIHVLLGGVYGKDHDVLNGHPRTGDLLPIMTHLGPAAPAGLARLETDALGPNHRGNLVACQFNLHKVSRHVLSPDGATYRTQDSDLIVSDNPDFHPTDVLEDADGSLLVIDTGGWYKLCCPTSQLHKPDVLGGIYRIRRPGSPLADPRGLRLPWDTMKAADLAALLSNPRPAVVRRAQAALARLGPGAVPALRRTLEEAPNETVTLQATWALARIPDRAARLANGRTAARWEEQPAAAQAALNAAALHGDRSWPGNLERLLRSGSPALQRALVTALGRAGAGATLGLRHDELLRGRPDRALDHAILHAMMQSGDTNAVARALRSTEPGSRRAAAIVLDQMPGGRLDPAEIIPWLSSTNVTLRTTAQWLAQRHRDWAPALTGFLQSRLSSRDLSASDQATLLTLFAQPGVSSLLAEAIQPGQSQRLFALQAMARSGLRHPPNDWIRPLAAAVADAQPDISRAAVSVLRALGAPQAPAPELTRALQSLARHKERPPADRVAALAALPSGWSPDAASLALLQSSLDPELPLPTRSDALAALQRSRLDPAQLLSLASTLRTAGPLELPRLVALFQQAKDEALGITVVNALGEARSLSSLRPDQVQTALAGFPADVQRRAESLLPRITSDATRQREHLESLAAQITSAPLPPDIRRGQAIFNSQKAACAGCHAIGYLGGNLGPDLTRIGQVRSERDLLESIVFPSASFVRSYEPMLVVTRAGEEHSGVLRRDTDDEMVLATGPSTEVRLARADIAEQRPGRVSVMPAGLDQQLTRQELADLIAFLKASR
ncbi:MAG: hypothetical protein RJA22_1079 [Verrucomicrobiota bacterium]